MDGCPPANVPLTALDRAQRFALDHMTWEQSCLCLTVQAEGAEITTVEGLASADGLHIVQQAFVEEHGLQCGFCTPGMMVRAASFLKENPNPTEEEIRWGMSGNLCRCTGYQNIIKAVKTAARMMQEA